MTAKIKNAAHSHGKLHKHRPKGVSARKFERVFWPYLPLVAVVSLVLAFGSQNGAFASAAINKLSRGKVLAYSTSMSVGGLLSATNSSRASNGVGSLSLNSQLNAAAQAKANDMAARNYWSHNTPEGNPPWVFDDAQGYAYQKLGENLATGFADEQATINGWLASPTHRDNMLDPVFTEVGFGYANIADYTAAGGGNMTIIVAHYGKPAGAPAPAPPPVTPPPVAAATPPPASSTPESSTPASGSAEASAANESTQNDTLTPTQQATRDAATPKPATTESPTSGVTLSYRATRANVALGSTPLATMSTGLFGFAIVAVALLWISKHAYFLRKAFQTGESFVFHHPIVDVGLLTIGALSYLMTQTAGFIL